MTCVRLNSIKGFTLVELSIVMIIIGLLIGGILKGQELIQNARISQLISQSKAVTVAYNIFWDNYNALPGDVTSAPSLIPNCTSANMCQGGNGDFYLGVGLPPGNQSQAWYSTPAYITSENTQFWKHLALADLLGGINPMAIQIKWGESHPVSSLGPGFHVRSSLAPSPIHGTMSGITLVLRNDVNGAWKCDNPGRDNCAVSPATAERIDKKMDDGVATSGTVQSISSGWSNGCGIPNQGINGPTGYASESSIDSCDLMFKVDR